MPLSAWIMLAIGCLVLYGGLGLTLGIALRRRRSRSRGSPTRGAESREAGTTPD
jgi:hypothetical protein